MHNFKVGDVVKWVEDKMNPHMTGKEFTVTHVTKQFVWVDAKEHEMLEGGWFPERFELVKTEQEAQFLINKAVETVAKRGASYSDPVLDFTRISKMWNGLFHQYLKDGMEFTPQDVAKAMICLKLSRSMTKEKADNILDTFGYAHCWELIVEEALKDGELTAEQENEILKEELAKARQKLANEGIL